MDGEIQAPHSAPKEAKAGPRSMTYGEAIHDATVLAMRAWPEVLVIGEGITDSGAVFGTTSGLLAEFGPKRVIESPLSEAAVTGICTGAALAGLRPIYVHQRMDFALLGLDQLVNHAAKWRYMYAGKFSVPFVLRCIVGKGWGQAAQHSQSLQALFAHIPGLKVVMPATPTDAKGLLLAALQDGNPVVSIEARALYSAKEEVQEGHFTVPIGRASVRRPGRHITAIGTSYQVPELIKAAEALAPEMEVEVVDLRSINPFDEELLVRSVSKTGLALVADTGWKAFGIGAEISALLHERCFGRLKAPVMRIGLPAAPTPCSEALEKLYYPNSDLITRCLRDLWTAQG
jgi:acetoin:2,6-dichlorophenolindophenol oxidoreductase subunit beta